MHGSDTRESDAPAAPRGASVLPGLGAALALAALAWPLSRWLGALLLTWRGVDPTGRASPVSAIPIAVILGLLVSNLTGPSPRLTPGLDLAVKKALRLGIILVGLKLSVLDVLKVGAIGVPVVVALVALALVSALGLARLMGVGDRLGALSAASTAICGITATLAVAPAIKADDREVAYTIANVTLFGLVAMLTYPYLAHALFASAPASAGLFLGTAIHDTSQVMGAAIAYKEVYGDERAMEVATVAKLTRNALLVVVVPLLAWRSARRGAGDGQPASIAALFPLFILGFLAMAAARTLGDLGLSRGGLALGVLGSAAWKSLITALGDQASTLALATALAGVGLSTRLSVLRGLGPRPLLVGLGAALVVGVGSLVLAWIAGSWL